MNLYTRCAHCGTVFKVATQQLQASNGRVRCGYCQAVFDGFATLTAEDPGQQPVDLAAEALTDLQPSPDTAVPATTQPASLAARASGVVTLPRPDPAASLYEWEFRMPNPKTRAGLWLGLSALLLFLLGGQAAFAFRQELMILVPGARDAYVKTCELLGCKPAWPAVAGYLHIESSDLKVTDPERPNEIELVIAIRNRAPVSMAFPEIELTLTDAREAVIARRIFSAAEYLGPAREATAFAAGRELPIQLFLDTGNLRAAGYRLYLFYP